MKDGREVNEAYRHHAIVVRRMNAGFKGVAWKESKKQFEADGVTLDEVVVQLKKHVDMAYDQIARSRTESPRAQEYMRAFQSIRMGITPGQCAMLEAHYRSPEMTITVKQLADAAGYKDWPAANLHYGLLGRALYDHVPTILETDPDGTPIYTFVLAEEGERASSGMYWKWILRPEVAAALESFGLNDENRSGAVLEDFFRGK